MSITPSHAASIRNIRRGGASPAFDMHMRVEGPGGLGAVLMAERAALLRFLRARGAADEAEDVLQELWLKLDRFVPEGPIGDPRSYIFRMADNLMHARVRSAMRRTQREQVWSEHAYPIEGEERASPERDLAARQRLQGVALALATLGERTQKIFRRFRIDGVSQAQIAAEEGISRSAVEKHLQRAYRLLATLADESDGDGAPVRERTG